MVEAQSLGAGGGALDALGLANGAGATVLLSNESSEPEVIKGYYKNTSGKNDYSGEAAGVKAEKEGQGQYGGGKVDVKLAEASGKIARTGANVKVAGETAEVEGHVGSQSTNAGLGGGNELFSADATAGADGHGSVGVGRKAALAKTSGKAFVTILGVQIGVEATVQVGVGVKASVGKRTGGMLGPLGIVIFVDWGVGTTELKEFNPGQGKKEE